MAENISVNSVMDIINGGSIIITWTYLDNKFKPDYAIMVKGDIAYDIKFIGDTSIYDTKESMVKSIKNRLDLIFDFCTAYADIYELNKWSAQYGMLFSYHIEEKQEEEPTTTDDSKTVLVYGSKTILVYCFLDSYDRYRVVNEKVHNEYPDALILNPYMMVANEGNPKNAFPIFYMVDQIKKMISCVDKVYIDLEYLNKEHKPNWNKLKDLIHICTDAKTPIEYSHTMESEYRYLVYSSIIDQFNSEIISKTGCTTLYPWYIEDITQTYLIYPKERCTARLRHSIITENSDMGKLDPTVNHYYLTIKSPAIFTGVRTEDEKEITKEEYELLLKWSDPKANTIKKTRLNVQVPGSDLIKLISIDHFMSGHMAYWSYDIMEVEFRNPPVGSITYEMIANELPLLKDTLAQNADNKFIHNITGNKAYSNKSLAFNDFGNPVSKLTVKEGNTDDVQ